MSNLNPLLQKINPPEAPTQEPEVVKGTDKNRDIELQKEICNDLPDSVWNNETNTCEKKVEKLGVNISGADTEFNTFASNIDDIVAESLKIAGVP